MKTAAAAQAGEIRPVLEAQHTPIRESCVANVIGTPAVSFFVAGTPVPKGSTRPFFNKHMKFPVTVQTNAAAQKPWVQAIQWEARQNIKEFYERAPLALRLTFSMPRPKGHCGKHGLKNSAPDWPVFKPDLDKLVRCVLDALTWIAWRDDSQVVRISADKKYCLVRPGVLVTISPVVQAEKP